MYYVYILSNKRNGTIYIGVTNNLSRRVDEHKKKLLAGFCKKYDLTKLVYAEVHRSIRDAIKREKQIKKWKRNWKIQLIESQNPNWNDLSEGFIL